MSNELRIHQKLFQPEPDLLSPRLERARQMHEANLQATSSPSPGAWAGALRTWLGKHIRRPRSGWTGGTRPVTELAAPEASGQHPG